MNTNSEGSGVEISSRLSDSIVATARAIYGKVHWRLFLIKILISSATTACVAFGVSYLISDYVVKANIESNMKIFDVMQSRISDIKSELSNININIKSNYDTENHGISQVSSDVNSLLLLIKENNIQINSQISLSNERISRIEVYAENIFRVPTPGEPQREFQKNSTER